MIQTEQKKFSLRKNDQVQVISGREKGKIGRVTQIHLKTDRVTVENINLVKRHTKASQQAAGGIVEKALPLHYSNVLLFCPKCNRGVRHGHRMVDAAVKATQVEGVKGKARLAKVRVCKRCKDSLDPA